MRKSCETCKNYLDAFYPFQTTCDECVSKDNMPPSKWEAAEFYEPDTNADRIRAMTDEELAKEFADCAIGLYCDTRKKGLPELPESVKRAVFDSLLEWLKQPAEDGGDHDEC